MQLNIKLTGIKANDAFMDELVIHVEYTPEEMVEVLKASSEMLKGLITMFKENTNAQVD